MTTPSTFSCFGLVIRGLDWNETRNAIEAAIGDHRRMWIVTANPEILLEAKRNAGYWSALHQADLRLVDGFGLAMTAKLRGHRVTRLTGVELSERLLELADEKRWTVAFVGGDVGVGEIAARAMRLKYPNAKLIVEMGGHVDGMGRGDSENDEAIHRLTLRAPDILLVAYGHPKQEYWIQKQLDGLPSVKVAVGIGGTLDFWAGKVKRAPAWMRQIGLEWLWRLVREPKRWKRIWNAVVVFPWTIWQEHGAKQKSAQ